MKTEMSGNRARGRLAAARTLARRLESALKRFADTKSDECADLCRGLTEAALLAAKSAEQARNRAGDYEDAATDIGTRIRILRMAKALPADTRNPRTVAAHRTAGVLRAKHMLEESWLRTRRNEDARVRPLPDLRDLPSNGIADTIEEISLACLEKATLTAGPKGRCEEKYASTFRSATDWAGALNPEPASEQLPPPTVGAYTRLIAKPDTKTTLEPVQTTRGNSYVLRPAAADQTAMALIDEIEPGIVEKKLRKPLSSTSTGWRDGMKGPYAFAVHRTPLWDKEIQVLAPPECFDDRNRDDCSPHRSPTVLRVFAGCNPGLQRPLTPGDLGHALRVKGKDEDAAFTLRRWVEEAQPTETLLAVREKAFTPRMLVEAIHGAGITRRILFNELNTLRVR